MTETVRADVIAAGDLASMPETGWKQPRRVHDVGRFAGQVVFIVEEADGSYDYNRKIIISPDREVHRHS